MKRLLIGAFSAACVLAACQSQTANPRTSASTPSTKANDDGSFALFESGQVRPLALSSDGTLLFAVNTPDNRLEIFSVQDAGLLRVASVPVGLEPVAVAARSTSEVWVVNHVSDSVSIVDIRDLSTARVVRTLLVGDEPRDIVFGGLGGARAFVTTAHRGQNSSVDPQLTTPGVGRADVWVFDADNLGESLGGAPMTVITLFSDTPRALAVSPDGSTVYAAAFHSGNRTTTVPTGSVAPIGLPPPRTNYNLIPGPSVGLIVKFNPDSSTWLDELNRSWNSAVKLSLPDKDVFAIDANANPPIQKIGAGGFFTGVGTVLFNMAVNPRSGKIYVSNTDAQNHNRFEGPGEFAGHTVRGHLAESRITVIDVDGSTVTPRRLNKHIDYDLPAAPTPNDQSRRSLATPNGMVVSSDGATLYVAAFGSGKVGIFDIGQLESDTFVPDTADHIELRGPEGRPSGGPSGVVLDESRRQLYVLTRFDNSLHVVSTETRQEVTDPLPMDNPEPDSVVNGRRFLYDASFTSSNGEASCSSCHIFGDFDSLAWDLGNPDGDPINNPGPFTVPRPAGNRPLHPMKGPMTTQSLRGMDNGGPMHWRGDRTGGNDVWPEPSQQPNYGSFDEVAAFKKFNVAFEGLLNRSDALTEAEMQAFTDFVLQIMYPPNPIRALDNSLTTDQQAGRDFYMTSRSDTVQTCNGCHVLDVDGNRDFAEVVRPGFFGTDGRYSFENESQEMKIPHLRNLYQKVGMFGMPPDPFFPVDPSPFMGDQVRGFGFLHDGSVDTVFRFHGAGVFVRTGSNPGGIPRDDSGAALRRKIESFMLAFDSNFAPIVGQQITLTRTNGAIVSDRISLLEARAGLSRPECDLVVKGRIANRAEGFLYRDGSFIRRSTGDVIGDGPLRALADQPGQELTFTCVPPGSGPRIAAEL